MDSTPIRVLLAKVGLDGHDRGVKVVARTLRDAGMDVIYSGLHRTPEEVVNTAIQEDVDVLGVSLLSGVQLTVFPKIFRLLDEKGAAMGSLVFAERLGRWRDDGIREARFLIGGADGFDEAERAAADLLLGFGAMTWPHLLARAMLAEQLWRATSILAGHPYHREG